jgi:hypothetical protein
MLTCGLLHHLLMESKGPRALLMAIIFIVVVPLMLAAILMSASDRLQPIAMWIAGISPLSLPVYTALNHLSITELPLLVERALPKVWAFWQGVHLLVIVYLLHALHQTRSRIAARAQGM